MATNETTKELKVKLQNARDILTNWQTNNPVLKQGEFAVVFDVDDDPTHYKLKIGDGATPFNDLPYFEDTDKISKEALGNANGIASLDANGKIPLWQLPEEIGGKPLYTVIRQVPEQLGTLIYNGESQMPVWKYYDPDAFIISGTASAKDAGEHMAIFQPAVGYVWEDGTQSPIYCKWVMQRKTIPLVPHLSDDEFSFNGILQTPTWFDFNPEELIIAGDTNGTAVGEYTTTFTPRSNYQWADGSYGTKEISWSIVSSIVTVPSLKNALTYNGNAQTPTWVGYDTDVMVASGALTGTNAETYTATFTLKAGYVWEDGTTDPVDVEWKINPKVIEVIPSFTGTLTYNGMPQSPEWIGYLEEALVMGGDITGTDAGNYATTFTPNLNYVWSDEILETLNATA